MRARLAWLPVCMALAAGACSRDKDPYDVMKPAQLLEEGDRKVRQADMAMAEKAYRRGLEKAEAAGVKPENLRLFLRPLFVLAVRRDDYGEAERIYNRMGPPAEVRMAHDLAVMLFKRGQLDQARAKGEDAAKAMQRPAATPEERALYVAAWTTVDRLRSARFDREAATEATEEVIAALSDVATFRMQYNPLPRGLRPTLTRYLDHLFATDREMLAHKIGDIIERIDQNAPPAESDSLCVPLYDITKSNLGCLLEMPAEAR